MDQDREWAERVVQQAERTIAKRRQAQPQGRETGLCWWQRVTLMVMKFAPMAWM